jgi:hypothetical protein
METQTGILVRALTDDAVKEAFKTADSLRRAGYIAELDLDGQEPEARWTIEVRGKGEGFTVVDRTKNEKIEINTINEVLVFLNKNKS